VYEPAIAADAEAAAALEWARSAADPLAAPLAAARATLLVGVRVLEALEILEALLDSAPADPEVCAQAQIAYSRALKILGRPADSLLAADAAVALATDPGSRANALTTRAFSHLMMGQLKAAVADIEQATALARELGPEAWWDALMAESSLRMDAGQLDLASELLDEADQIRVDVSHLGSRHPLDGSLALLRHRPHEAAQHYALSLELDEQRGEPVWIYGDLVGLADALAMNHQDSYALEVSGIAEAQLADIGGSESARRRVRWRGVPERNLVAESEQRIPAQAAALAKARGRTVAAGYRATRAREIARAATGQSARPQARAVSTGSPSR